MYLSCHTQDEIADAVGTSVQVIKDEISSDFLDNCPKNLKLSATFEDDFEKPLYNVWSFAKKTNEVSHFGNTLR